MPKAWKRGNADIKRSAGVGSITVRICSTLANKLPWLWTTPFGLPSEPEVNRTKASS